MKRRKFLRSTPALLLAPGLLGCSQPTADTSARESETEGANEKKRLGVALLGLGGYAENQIRPALELTKHCYLAGIISGTPEKLTRWQEQYGVKPANSYSYDEMEEVVNNTEIDVVYVITPTATHRDFSVRAARAGKHVWCEKPMAMTPEECQDIIDVCRENEVSLSIGYRMLHEPNTQKLIGITQRGAYGAVTSATALAGYGGSVPPSDYWRGQRKMGGGALYDMGVYTINGLAYGTQMRPEAVVKASQQRPEGVEVDLTTSYTLRYPNGVLAEGKTSVVEKMNLLRIEAENGWYQMEPMQPYNGVKGLTSDGEVLGPPVPNQQSLQMDDDALAIMNGTPVIATGAQGKEDVTVIRAIIESAESGEEVTIVY